MKRLFPLLLIIPTILLLSACSGRTAPGAHQQDVNTAVNVAIAATATAQADIQAAVDAAIAATATAQATPLPTAAKTEATPPPATTPVPTTSYVTMSEDELRR